jgi:hypothetical protein
MAIDPYSGLAYESTDDDVSGCDLLGRAVVFVVWVVALVALIGAL